MAMKSDWRNSQLISFFRFLLSIAIFVVFVCLFSIVSFVNILLQKALHSGKDFNKTRAKFGRVMWRRKFHEFELTSDKDFLCIFSSTVELDYVLKPNVSLYAVTKNEAVFIETHKNVNIYSSDENCFFHFAQFERAQNVIKMSISCFHALAERLGGPSCQVIWIQHTVRCGSTLLCQILETVPGTLVMSEPHAPTSIDYMQTLKLISQPERESLIRSTITLLCKPHPHAKRICVKGTGLTISMIKEMSTFFPDIQHVFIYRNCKANTSSYLALLTSMTYTEVMRTLFDSEWFTIAKPWLSKIADIHMVCKVDDSPTSYVYPNTVAAVTQAWINFITVARDAKKHIPNLLFVKYEDLVSDKFKTCKIIFEALDLDIKYLDLALKAFDKDSQRGSIVSRCRLATVRRRVISNEHLVKANEILASYDFPPMGVDFRI